MFTNVSCEAFREREQRDVRRIAAVRDQAAILKNCGGRTIRQGAGGEWAAQISHFISSRNDPSRPADPQTLSHLRSEGEKAPTNREPGMADLQGIQGCAAQQPLGSFDDPQSHELYRQPLPLINCPGKSISRVGNKTTASSQPSRNRAERQALMEVVEGKVGNIGKNLVSSDAKKPLKPKKDPT